MTGFFDDALEAADRVDAITFHPMGQNPSDLAFVTRALREAVALNRGIMNENAGLKQRMASSSTGEMFLESVSTRDLLREVERRMS